MAGLFAGVLCGLLEFLLLRKLTQHVTAGTAVPFWLPIAKLCVLAAFLIPCGFFAREQLHLAGIGVAAALMLCAAVNFIVQAQRDRRARGASGRTGGVRHG